MDDEEKARIEALRLAGGELLEKHGVRVGGWRIKSSKQSILKSDERENWEAKLGTRHLPEMVFGHNSLELVHEHSGVRICFNAFDALSEWKRENLPPVEVPAAAKWKFRSNPSDQIILDYDYTFTTPYSGGQSLVAEAQAGSESLEAAASLEWMPCDNRIDFVGLQARDPILFYDEVILYEDELSDNGISFLSVKVRVMPTCWFLLLRFWLRVDGVLMRLRDTRMFCSFQGAQQTPVIVRDICHREDTFEALAVRGCFVDSVTAHDPNLVSEFLQLQKQQHEKLVCPALKQT